jgi:para-aminobenzoate synthetase
MREHLATDPRFLAENLMIVDLLRHDIATVSQLGTVTVPRLMNVESYVNVHQLVTTVEGRLRDELTSIAALRSIFPAASMTGAPKVRTTQLIYRLEATARCLHGGIRMDRRRRTS